MSESAAGKVAQRAFSAAGNRRAETEGGEPSVSESAATEAASRARAGAPPKGTQGAKKPPRGEAFLRKLLLVSFKGVAFAADAVYDVAEDFGIGF